MAALISARSPASSRQTMPISSVTLAWRILVTRSNLWPNCQMSGLVMSLGGYIYHKRVCCGVLAVVGADFFLAAIGFDFELVGRASSRAGSSVASPHRNGSNL